MVWAICCHLAFYQKLSKIPVLVSTILFWSRLSSWKWSTHRYKCLEFRGIENMEEVPFHHSLLIWMHKEKIGIIYCPSVLSPRVMSEWENLWLHCAPIFFLVVASTTLSHNLLIKIYYFVCISGSENLWDQSFDCSKAVARGCISPKLAELLQLVQSFG